MEQKNSGSLNNFQPGVALFCPVLSNRFIIFSFDITYWPSSKRGGKSDTKTSGFLLSQPGFIDNVFSAVTLVLIAHVSVYRFFWRFSCFACRRPSGFDTNQSQDDEHILIARYAAMLQNHQSGKPFHMSSRSNLPQQNNHVSHENGFTSNTIHSQRRRFFAATTAGAGSPGGPTGCCATESKYAGRCEQRTNYCWTGSEKQVNTKLSSSDVYRNWNRWFPQRVLSL